MGSMKRARARLMRMRHPPEKELVARCCILSSNPAVAAASVLGIDRGRLVLICRPLGEEELRRAFAGTWKDEACSGAGECWRTGRLAAPCGAQCLLCLPGKSWGRSECAARCGAANALQLYAGGRKRTGLSQKRASRAILKF